MKLRKINDGLLLSKIDEHSQDDVSKTDDVSKISCAISISNKKSNTSLVFFNSE